MFTQGPGPRTWSAQKTIRFSVDNFSARSFPRSNIPRGVQAGGAGAGQPLNSSHRLSVCPHRPLLSVIHNTQQSSPETGLQPAYKLSRYSCIEEISRGCKTCSRSWANILAINPHWAPYYCSYMATIAWDSLFKASSKMPKLHSSDRPFNYRDKLYRGSA